MKFDDVDAAVAGTRFMTSAQGRKVYEFIVENNLGRVLERGFAHGKSTCYLAAAADELGGNAHVLTIDRTAAMARTPTNSLRRAGSQNASPRWSLSPPTPGS